MVLNSSIRRYFDEQNLSIWELPLLTFEYSECKVSLQLSEVLTVYIGCVCAFLKEIVFVRKMILQLQFHCLLKKQSDLMFCLVKTKLSEFERWGSTFYALIRTMNFS